MNRKIKSRAIFLIWIVTILIAIFFVVFKSLEDNVVYFISPTEIAAMDKIALETDAHVIGISGDNEFCKLAWKNDNDMIANINHTLAADCGNILADDLGIVSDENVPYRATYIVDEMNWILHVSVNVLDTGRNADEVLRTYKALRAGGLTGCSWQEGDEFVA